ncbi:hypothetical protein HNR46_001584 [Haloferula luteola]|uniref:DUF1320 domain-containing protein n=1 Tax=Haloferula luteola TaxID=595692 RepID=A0A840V9H4_9BACT|nr:hypothetical protein [Haloferula luteola]MBB5351348.1 hypothetical protein [Haloferula luteola]
MAWIEFTPAQVKLRLSARELNHYVNQSKADGEDAEARITEIVSQVCNEIRGKIRANPDVAGLGPDGTLPDSCISAAAIIARHSMITQVPLDIGEIDPRRDEYRDARKFIDSIPNQPGEMFVDPHESTSSRPSSVCWGGDRKLNF